jgi:pyruvate dehydrogenase E2 component (dihydrolipoamide acetyltransferase)
MPIKIVVPRLGWSMDEGTFGEWLKKDGDVVKAGDMIFVLEGDKASQEIESFDAGSLHIPLDGPQPGETVAVGQLLGYLLADGESAPVRSEAAVVSMPPTSSAGREAIKPIAGPAARRRAREQGVEMRAPNSVDPTDRLRIADVASKQRSGSRIAVSPRARRKARELGVEWSDISGSGRNGRIRERDVLAFAKRGSRGTMAEDLPAASGTPLPISKIRRTIAQRMLAGVQQTAPVTLTTKVDAAELVALRERLKADHAASGVPSYNDLLVKLAATALPESRELNACWHNDSVFVYDEINIAIAIDTKGGLVAPVIKDVPALSLDEIAEESRMLGEQARAGKLSQSQLQGGTFTITNLGMFDIDFFTPIVNLPQSAILGVGRIVREPVVRGDAVVPGTRLALSLTFDHRVIDGAAAGKWLQHLSEMIAQPDQHLSVNVAT